MKKTILVYRDKGVFRTSAMGWERAFKVRGYNVIICNKKALLHNIHRSDIAAIVMPGGNSGNPALGDDTIKASLGEDGTRALEKYMAHGVLLLVCGSAYRFSKEIIFQYEKDGVKEHLNELGAGFYDAVTRNWRYYDDSPATAEIARLSLNGRPLSIFYHGGPFFEFGKTEAVKPFLFFEDGQIAGAEIEKEKGNVIVLSMHPEFVGITPSYPVEKGDSIAGRATEIRTLVNHMNRHANDHHTLLDFIEHRISQTAKNRATRTPVVKRAQFV